MQSFKTFLLSEVVQQVSYDEVLKQDGFYITLTYYGDSGKYYKWYGPLKSKDEAAAIMLSIYNQNNADSAQVQLIRKGVPQRLPDAPYASGSRTFNIPKNLQPDDQTIATPSHSNPPDDDDLDTLGVPEFSPRYK